MYKIEGTKVKVSFKIVLFNLEKKNIKEFGSS